MRTIPQIRYAAALKAESMGDSALLAALHAKPRSIKMVVCERASYALYTAAVLLHPFIKR